MRACIVHLEETGKLTHRSDRPFRLRYPQLPG